MKKVFSILLVLTLLMSLSSGFVLADDPVVNGEQILYAGQDEPVGHVYVVNDGNTITVTYELDPPWVLTQTHVAVALELDGFPLTKKGNPKPGQFTDGESFEYAEGITMASYTMDYPIGAEPGDDVLIAAHAIVEYIDCVLNAEAPYGGKSIVGNEQGLTNDLLTPVKLARSNPLAVLEYETGKDETNFYSLGFATPEIPNPYIEIEFEYPIVNGPGTDLQVVEDTWGLPYPLESAEVYVRNSDTDPWIKLGVAGNQTPDSVNIYHTISEFDLEDVGLDSAKYVKVVDISKIDDFVSKKGADGFDLNAVLALHDNTTCTEYKESAWAGGTGFVEKGNWATYFDYTLIDQYTRVEETIFVDGANEAGNDRDIELSTVLENGQEYYIVANGTYRFAEGWGVYDQGLADAKFNCRNIARAPDLTGMTENIDYSIIIGEDSIWVDGYAAGYTNGLQVKLDGNWVLWEGLLDLDNHEYNKIIVGTGNSVEFSIFDSNYSDNSGFIEVNIFKKNW